MERHPSSARWFVPITMTLLCGLFAGWVGVTLGREVLLVSTIMMPVPLLVLWLSWAEQVATRRRVPRVAVTAHDTHPRDALAPA